MKSLRSLLENYPSMAHIGLEGEDQEQGVRKDLYSMDLVKNAIDSIRDKRMETSPLPPLPRDGIPVLTLLAGYEDGKTETANFHLRRSNSYYPPTLSYSRGDAQEFLGNKKQNSLAQTSDALKAKELFSRIDVEPVYAEMERQALSMMGRFKMYYALFKRCQVKYVTDGTASIWWNPSLKRFVLRLNKAFLVYMSVMNLVNGHPKSTMSSLRELYNDKGAFDPDTEAMAHTLLYVLLHEMGHIFYQHTGKRMGLYSNFNHMDVNIYGDVLINLNLTKMMGTQVDPRMVPNIGLGKDRYLKGRTDSAKKSVQKFVASAQGLVAFNDYSQLSPLSAPDKFRDEPATFLGIFSPGSFVQVEAPTFVLLNFYKKAQQALSLDPPPKRVKGSAEEGEKKEPTKISLPLTPGQVVIIKATGEQGVVVAVGEATPNPEVQGDHNQQVTVVPRSSLPPEVQKRIDDMVSEIEAPPVSGSDETEKQIEGPPPPLG